MNNVVSDVFLDNNKELLEKFSIELLEKETLKKEEIDIWKKLCWCKAFLVNQDNYNNKVKYNFLSENF